MSEKSYTSMLHKVCAFLKIVLSHFLHFGRVTAPAQCDLEEVNGSDTRALGNWKSDVFGNCYSTQLPLPAMRVMAGHDKRQGFHVNPRTTYFGDETHQELFKKIFPWIDNAIDMIDPNKHKTATQFLSLMSSLRSVIIQDAAIMLLEGREHYIFDHNPEIFKSSLFIDFQQKLIGHINRHKRDERFNTTIDNVLPGVINRLDNMTFTMVGQQETLKSMNGDIKGVIKNYRDFKDMYIKENMDQMDLIKSKIDIGINNVKDSVGSVFQSEIRNICKHILTSTDHNPSVPSRVSNNLDDTTAIVPFRKNMEMLSPTTNERNDLNTTIVINPYVLPKLFPTFAEMIHHWYKIVKDQDRSNCKDWRKHLTKAEKRRFQRLSRIMRAFQKVMIEGVKIREAENQFEAFYQSNNKSLTKLCDKYAKQFLL